MRKRIVIAFILPLLISAILFAQATSRNAIDNGPAITARSMQRMASRLNLTSEQQSQIQSLFQNQQQQIDAARKNASLTPLQLQANIVQIRQATHEKIMSVLTTDQRQILQQRWSPQTTIRGLGPLQAVNLTPDQQSKIRPMIRAEHAQIKSVREDASLTPEQKRDKILQLRQATQTSIQGLLTPEQLQKIQQLKSTRPSTRRSGPNPNNVR